MSAGSTKCQVGRSTCVRRIAPVGERPLDGGVGRTPCAQPDRPLRRAVVLRLDGAQPADDVLGTREPGAGQTLRPQPAPDESVPPCRRPGSSALRRHSGAPASLVVAGAPVLDDVVHVLVAAAAEVDEDRPRLHLPGLDERVRDGVRALERRDDALAAAELEEGVAAGVVGAGHVLHTARVLEVAVLGPDARVVEPAGARVHGRGLALLVLQQVAAEAVDHALRAVGHGRGVLADGLAATQGLDADELHGVVEEAGEDAHGVGAAADARLDHVGEVTGHLDELLARLHADDLLEVAHHEREGMRADHRPDAVDHFAPTQRLPRSEWIA